MPPFREVPPVARAGARARAALAATAIGAALGIGACGGGDDAPPNVGGDDYDSGQIIALTDTAYQTAANEASGHDNFQANTKERMSALLDELVVKVNGGLRRHPGEAEVELQGILSGDHTDPGMRGCTERLTFRLVTDAAGSSVAVFATYREAYKALIYDFRQKSRDGFDDKGFKRPSGACDEGAAPDVKPAVTRSITLR